ncbi:MAG TPA: hypothetical protein VIM11_17695 [Tepidisphaeraceae bacterium]|jgi:hypothetical protein
MGKSWILLALLAAGCAAHNGTAKSGKEKDEGNETKIKFSEAPEAVQKTLTEQANGQKIESVDKQTKDGKTVFEADAVINGTNYEIVVASDGTLVKKSVDKEEDEKKGKEKKD